MSTFYNMARRLQRERLDRALPKRKHIRVSDERRAFVRAQRLAILKAKREQQAAAVESIEDYATHILSFRRSVALMKLALSQAPAHFRVPIMKIVFRELCAVVVETAFRLR